MIFSVEILLIFNNKIYSVKYMNSKMSLRIMHSEKKILF